MTAPNGTLLVVDDDESNREVLSKRLQLEGFRVAVAEDGGRAIELLRSRRFDLILLDVLMPGQSGLDILGELRRLHPATELPVIMTTALDETSTVVEALQRGANDYVSKSLDFPVVLARIEAHLSLKRAVEDVLRLERSLEQRNHDLTGANARLAEANRRMQRDLKTAARIQETFLPRSEPQFPQARFAWHYRPCEELAGDGLNVFALDHRHAALYVFDVSGHGVASALLSVTLSRTLSPPSDPSSVLRPKAGPRSAGAGGTSVPPAEVADVLNRMFPFDEATEQYFTMVYGVLDMATGQFRYVSAGHPGAVHLEAAGGGRIVECRSFPIGMAEQPYEEHVLALNPGDRLVLYTDGILEAVDGDGRVFGSQRLVQTLEQVRGLELDDAVASLLDELGRWTRSTGLRDDVSLVAVEYLGPPCPQADDGRSMP